MLINQVPQSATENISTAAELESVSNDYWVELAESLDRLRDNKDFQKVILEGYFKDRAIAGVSLLATDHVKQTGQRPEVMETLVAISGLEDYFAMVANLGYVPEDDEE